MITEVSIKHRGFHLLSIVQFSLSTTVIQLGWAGLGGITMFQVSNDIEGCTMLCTLVAGKAIIRDASKNPNIANLFAEKRDCSFVETSTVIYHPRNQTLSSVKVCSKA